MSRTTGPIDYFYWSGYQMGLAGPHPDEKAILSMIGSDTPMRDGEGRGYRDGGRGRESDQTAAIGRHPAGPLGYID